MTPPISSVTMPKWGIEMTEGTITNWRVVPGAIVARGQEILDVETEKIVNAVEAPAGGVLRRIIAAEGETRAVGELIGIIADESVGEAEIERFAAGFVANAVSFEPTDAPLQVPPPAQATVAANAGVGDEEEARVSPIARRLAVQLGIEIGLVKGTGRNGRVSKEDVEAYAARAQTAGIAEPPTQRLPMSSRRKTIARRLQESKQTIPHYRLDIAIDFGSLLRLRRDWHDAARRPSVNDYLLRAAALTLIEYPDVNAQFDGEQIVRFAHADIAIAVAAEAGLVTPILRGVDIKSIGEVAVESRGLVERARQGTLQREEIGGGSFTISNLGMFGISRFDAIINAPQVAILAVGAVEKRAVVRGGALAIGEMATLTLSADHRVVDGAVGAAFLRSLRRRIEDPGAL